MESAILRHLREQSGSIDPSVARAVPSSFDPDDPALFVIARPLSQSWDSLTRVLRAARSSAVLVRIPLFWQIESALYAASSAAGVTICINEEANMPLGARAIETAGAELVLTTAEDAEVFGRYLWDAGKPLPRAWHLIHRAESSWHMPDALKNVRAAISQEVHLAPGIPLLVQCEILSAQKAQRFHVSDLFGCEISDETRISSVPNDPLALERMPLPFMLRELAVCSCGTVEVERV